MLDQTKLSEFKRLTYVTQTNDQATVKVKKTLNYYVSYEYRHYLIDQLVKEFLPEESKMVADYYMTKEQILEMHKAGMIIGSHTVNHPVLSRLNKEKQEFEIHSSFNYLEKIVTRFHHKTFCYPYGGFHSFNQETENILSDINCQYAFNVEQRDIEPQDLLKRPQALPRYDCNQFKFGQVRKAGKPNYIA